MISVRMRAELKGLHVSGAERIVDEGQVERVVKELLKRPKDYDKMVITLEKLEEIFVIPKALTIYSYDFDSVQSARDFAVKKLEEAGISRDLAKRAIELLEKGKSLEEVSLEELKAFSELFEEDALSLLKPEKVVERRKSYGGTAKEQVLLQLEVAKREEGL